MRQLFVSYSYMESYTRGGKVVDDRLTSSQATVIARGTAPPVISFKVWMTVPSSPLAKKKVAKV